MTRPEFTVVDLRRILVAAAGTDDDVDLSGDILDSSFSDLGYDSLALIETAAHVSKEYGVALDDDAVTETASVRRFIELVNAA